MSKPTEEQRRQAAKILASTGGKNGVGIAKRRGGKEYYANLSKAAVAAKRRIREERDGKA